MTGQHVRPESATATAPASWPWPNQGPARINDLRSAMRGLSISEPSSQAASPGATLSPMSSMLGGSSRASASGGPSERAAVERRLDQLRGCTQRLRAARVPGSDPGSVDSAYDEFARVMHEASDAIEAVLAADKPLRPTGTSRRARNGSVAVERLESMSLSMSMGTAQGSLAGGGDIDGLRASFSTLGLGAPEGPARGDPSLAAIWDWRAVLVKLLESHRSSLAATIQAHDRNAPPELAARALDDPGYRAGMIHEMRTRKSPLSSDPAAASPRYWSLYERRFEHYDTVKAAVMHADRLLTTAAPGADKRARKTGVREYVVSPRGNAVLEFENSGSPDTPLLRFRVSSHMLAETSPIFEAVFGGQFSHPRILDRDLRELDGQLPREPPRSVTCADGSCVRLYSMPQLEPNKEEALTILLHAAHMQNDKVPREVSFAQFTAIAEVCLRYMCTSPLELMVEHRWLPAWVHKATEQQPDGILLISYAFGLRRLFTRMSKTAVLNIVDEQELRAKPWPKAVKDKIWAVRTAKLDQVFSTCVSTVQEYFRPPARPSNDAGAGAGPPRGRDPHAGPPVLPPSCPAQPPLPTYISLMSLTSAPRCPRGDHWCDATSLGWLLLVLNELQLAWTVVNPSVLSYAQSQQSQQSQTPRSLAQLLDVLRSIPSPRHPPHPASTVCDPAPAFRAAVNDVYNSISGLTLFDVDGKRHGWGLSRHRLNEPQTIQNVPLGKLTRSSLTGSSIQDQVSARGSVEMDNEELMPGSGSDTDTTVDQEQEIQRGSAPDSVQRQHPPPAFAPDEALFLRIMKNAETFDDLHALALVSPASYAAFKNNELALMRPLVGAWRRRTLSALAGGPSRPQDLLPQELARLEGLQARSEENMPRNHAPAPSPPLLSRHQSTQDALAEAAQLELLCPNDVEEGHDTSPDSDSREGEETRRMTEEEAGLILWPEQPSPSNLRVAAAPRGAFDRDSDDKFLAQDLCLLPEHKSLAVLGDKSLRVDLDKRKGIDSA
ncbi:hypothetical protein KVR01_003482 [Diaporthe batatas]|uniref:uncharacterized protein n=1 Tax=Diaporthe batatas TaxID=748121 RepID=UPI001D05AEFE|nr:uncharacterized protein KVR01_003482 [Diaporthe batatas]KAG8167793.1 hypothetical protein KVR01_003482 [Diaporthe batatas]